MHYINQCLEPGRILNHINSITNKKEMIKKGNYNPKQANMIELQLTDKCNLECFHCHFRNQGDVFFQDEWIDIVINEILPKAISLAGGGEPTLYPNFDETIKKLKDGKTNPQIGLISNGVLIPKGNWPEMLSWLRVSLYSIQFNQYAGRETKVQKKVIDNILKYMNMDALKMLGVSLLYYKGNLLDCINLTFELYKKLKVSTRSIERFNIQYKRAFVLCDPRSSNGDINKQNLKILPDKEEIMEAIKHKEKLCSNDVEFEVFLNTCTNYSQIEEYLFNGEEKSIAQTDSEETVLQNFANCYVTLENRLITPKGYVYPCPSIAENRDPELMLGHILDKDEIYMEKILKYYQCNSEWCNKRFCRHTQHNALVQNYFDNGILPEFSKEILEDNFF